MRAGNINIYQARGYEDRDAYLQALAEDNGWPLSELTEVAMLLGPEEDFDGLISLMEDYHG